MTSITDTLENFGLGLARDGSVVLRPHDPRWMLAAEFETTRLTTAIGNKGFTFHHVGSTSIPTICAKPILDFVILASSLKEIDQRQNIFEALGYEAKGEYGIPGRRYFVLYNAQKTKGFVHLHAFEPDHKEAIEHLLFRDYLIAAPEVAAQYQKLKRDLVNSGIQRANYTESKAPFIQEILAEAKIWRESLELRSIPGNGR